MLVGRERDIRDLTRAVQNRRLNFLYGESGSGKSTLIKLGLARELNQTGAWIPIYLDIWGQDWIRGPRKHARRMGRAERDGPADPRRAAARPCR
jgi:ABC-type multidrug transport system ATPase subunit